MAALGWIINLNFAASDAGAVTPPTVTSTLSTLLLLGACLPILVNFLG